MKKTAFIFLLLTSLCLKSQNIRCFLFDINDSISKTHYALGMPIGTDSIEDYIIARSQYTLGYNPQIGSANWVAWHLHIGWFGSADRYKGRFITDTIVDKFFIRITHNHYTNSGYDRGHIVRSKERSTNADDNKSTFILSNIFPQTPDLNRGVWLNFEYYCEKLCTKENKQLYVYAGGLYSSNKSLKDENIVAIPDTCYKIILILDQNQSIEDINSNTQIIAVAMPNISGIRRDKWEKYITTVRKIEESSGFDFFSNLSQDLQDILETRKFKP